MLWQRAVVTGAASGIGRALATRLVADGTEVVLADRNRAELDRVTAELGGTAIPTDVADPVAMRALAKYAVGADLVCLNAGVVGVLGAIWEVGAEDTDDAGIQADKVGSGCRFGKCPHRDRISDIGGNGGAAEVGCHPIDANPIPIGEHHLGAAGGQPGGQGPTNSARRAGHHRALPKHCPSRLFEGRIVGGG